jgi:hypothetical protein
MRGRREDGHVDTELGDELLGADPSDAGHRIQLGDLSRERGDLLVDPGGQLLDPTGQLVDPFQHHLAEEPVMVVEVPSQGLFELAELGPHARAGQLGEHLGVTLSCDHGLEHVAARHPEDVACHRRQLDLGVLQELLHALLLPGPLPDERAPVTGQVTQPADRGWRHEAWPAPAPLDHLG